MKKALIVLFTILLLSTTYFGYQSLMVQRQIDNKVRELIKENDLIESSGEQESTEQKTTEQKTTEEESTEGESTDIKTNPVLDTTSMDYGTALSRVEDIDQLINLFRYDLAESDYAAYGFKALDLYKAFGAETFIVTLAAREDITLQEEIVKMMIGELKLVRKVDSSLDLQHFIDGLVTFINEKDPTGNELRLAYDFRWQLEALKNGKLED